MVLSLFAATAALAISPPAQKNVKVTVRAEACDYLEAPVRVLVPVPKDFAGATLVQGDRTIPCQARLVGGKAEIAWVVRNLKKGTSETYALRFDRAGSPAPVSGVIIDKNGKNLDIRINNTLFTTYDCTTGPNKPYFYPIQMDGIDFTRHYPLKTEVPGETKDHPHHRGLWFTHGEVNGLDFWSEGEKAATSRTEKLEQVTSGAVFGSFVASTAWVDKEGNRIADDVREVVVHNTSAGRLMDFTVTLKPVGKPLHLGDTKEGSFGIRVPDTMRVTTGKGHIVTEAGDKDAAAWGKRAKWVDYYGPAIGGAEVGIAIFDHPSNPRFPTYWHVRDYGLFAANPFGVHDFVKGQTKGAGDITVPLGSSITFKYRVLFHKGDTNSAQVAAAFDAFSQPPVVEVK